MKEEKHDSDSTPQREVEDFVIKKLGLKQKEKPLVISEVSFEFDGVSDDECTVAEVYAGTGKLKSAQRFKISQDILKMVLYEKLTNKSIKKMIVVVDESIADELNFQKHMHNKWQQLDAN